MSAPLPPSDPPGSHSDDLRLPAALPPPPSAELAAVATGVVQVALVVAGWGLLALGVNRDPVDDPAIGPLVGPAMAGASGIAAWWGARLAVRGRRIVLSAVGATIGALVVMLAIGGVGVALAGAAGGGFAASFLAGVTRFALGGFVELAAALAGCAVLGSALVTSGQRRRRSGPRGI